jgi:hypothetical protein
MNKVLDYAQLLCEVLRTNYQSYAIEGHRKFLDDPETKEYHRQQIDKLCEGEGVYEFYIDTLRKYYKVVMNDGNQSHSHCFIDKETGDVFKSASWKSPAKGVRFNLLDDNSRVECYKRADWAGGYLYK